MNRSKEASSLQTMHAANFDAGIFLPRSLIGQYDWPSYVTWYKAHAIIRSAENSSRICKFTGKEKGLDKGFICLFKLVEGLSGEMQLW